jgi:hypothetical protein
MASVTALLKKNAEMAKELAAARASAPQLTLPAITAALKSASEDEMVEFLSVIQTALGTASISDRVPPQASGKKSAAKKSAAAAAAAPEKPKKEASEAVMEAVGGWNAFVAGVKAELLAEGKTYVKKKSDALAEDELNYDTLLKIAGARWQEAQGKEPKAKKPAAPKKAAVKTTVTAAEAAKPPKPVAAAPPPAPAAAKKSVKLVVEDAEDSDWSEDEEAPKSNVAGGGPSAAAAAAEEDEEDELKPLEYEGEEFWVDGENVVYEKSEFGGLGGRVGVLDSDTGMLVRDE